MPLSTARSGSPNPLQTCTDGLDMAIQVLDSRRSRRPSGIDKQNTMQNMKLES